MGSGKLVFGTLLIAAGLVLLGAQLGYLPPDVGHPLLKLWPLLFVAFGLALLANALKSPLLGWFAALIVIGGVAYGAFWMPRRPPSGEARFVSTVDLDRAQVASLTVQTATLGGSLDVAAAVSRKGRSLGIEVWHVAGEAEAAHRFSASGHAGLLVWPSEQNFSRGAPVGGCLRVSVPEGTPLRLDGTSQFSSSHLALAGLRPERVTVKLIGSKLDLSVGDRGRPTEVTLRGFLSTARLRIPGDCPVRLSFTSRLTTRSVPPDFVEHAPGRGNGSVFTGDGHGAPIHIRIEGPLLDVKVERERLSAV
jgi:cell wall-active antibiotic response 4TMS protein YvqF